jgi:Tfp pilus assembly PilM family ATPase
VVAETGIDLGGIEIGISQIEIVEIAGKQNKSKKLNHAKSIKISILCLFFGKIPMTRHALFSQNLMKPSL